MRNTFAYADSYSYGNGHVHTNSYSHGNGHVYTDSHGNGDGYSNLDAYAYQHAAAYSYPETSPDATPSAAVLIGTAKAGTRE